MSLGDSQTFAFNGIDGCFESAWEKIAAGEALVCAKSAVRFEALPPPDAVVIDVCFSGLLS